MPKEKKVVQDIVPTGRRSIRNVAPKKLPVEEEEQEAEEQVPIRRAPPSISMTRSQTNFPPAAPPSRRPVKVSSSGKKRFPSILLTFGIVFICIAVIAIALSLLYSKAAVTITPKTAHVDINGTFTAKKGEAALSSSSPRRSMGERNAPGTQSTERYRTPA